MVGVPDHLLECPSNRGADANAKGITALVSLPPLQARCDSRPPSQDQAPFSQVACMQALPVLPDMVAADNTLEREDSDASGRAEEEARTLLDTHNGSMSRMSVQSSSSMRSSETLPHPLTGGVPEYFCWLQGCVLLTAPHSLSLRRGGGPTKERVRTHLRERWTAEIALCLARELRCAGLPAAVMIWNRAVQPRTAKPSKKRLDPNFLTREQFEKSPWHCALHRWAIQSGSSRDVPLLHVDFHGKCQEPGDSNECLDLGTAHLVNTWPQHDQQFVKSLRQRFKKLVEKNMVSHKMLDGQGRPLMVDVEPKLNGFWAKRRLKTMSQQSALLGIPSFQLEASPRLRQRLISDPPLSTALAGTIAKIYREVVQPWWLERRASELDPQFSPTNPLLAEKVLESRPADSSQFEAWSSQLFDELVQMERETCEFQI